MRRTLALILLCALAGLPACGSDSSSDGATRTVLVDYNHDEFATSYFAYYPQYVEVHPGDTIDFKQAWTGEPHTVTMGQLMQPLGNAMSGYFDGTKAVPEDEPEDVLAASKDIPGFFQDEGFDLVQTSAQPCYLDTGPLPADGKACEQVEEQPTFNGRQAFYNSGFIPYEGNDGNRFKVELSDDIREGNYFYMCLIHGSIMGGYIRVKPRTADIPSQGDVNRTARKALDADTARLASSHRKALRGEGKPDGVDVVAGAEPEEFKFPIVLSFEFYPKTYRAKVGQKVTWSTNGHTVSFNVPKYGPQVIVEDDGTVELNPKAYDVVNAPKPPDGPPSEGGEGGGESEPFVMDAGTYDPDKFVSSGVQDAVLFQLTFDKAGTYKYACLIHPRMIGTVVISK